MDPFLKKIHDRPIDGRFALVRRIGSGGFGVVYLANDLSSRREVALKLERQSVDPSMLRDEAERYESLKGQTGVPQVFWFGYHDTFRVLALELLGPSLEDLFRYCGGRFTLKTTLLIIDQLLCRLETLHGRGIVHRDIKPRNFLLGTGRHGNDIYVTDFGLVVDYSPDSARDESADCSRLPCLLVGTAGFASVRGHQGIAQQTPRDDLESLGYMAVYFSKGRLPWQDLKVKDKEEGRQAVMEMKMAITVDQLCDELPNEFHQYMDSVKSLGYGDLPDYGRLRAMFRHLAAREGLQYDHVYDWTIRDYLEKKI